MKIGIFFRGVGFQVKSFIELVGRHPLATGLLGIVGLLGLVFSLYAYYQDRAGERASTAQIAQVQDTIAHAAEAKWYEGEWVQSNVESQPEIRETLIRGFKELFHESEGSAHLVAGFYDNLVRPALGIENESGDPYGDIADYFIGSTPITENSTTIFFNGNTGFIDGPKLASKDRLSFGSGLNALLQVSGAIELSVISSTDEEVEFFLRIPDLVMVTDQSGDRLLPHSTTRYRLTNQGDRAVFHTYLRLVATEPDGSIRKEWLIPYKSIYERRVPQEL